MSPFQAEPPRSPFAKFDSPTHLSHEPYRKTNGSTSRTVLHADLPKTSLTDVSDHFCAFSHQIWTASSLTTPFAKKLPARAQHSTTTERQPNQAQRNHHENRALLPSRTKTRLTTDSSLPKAQRIASTCTNHERLPPDLSLPIDIVAKRLPRMPGFVFFLSLLLSAESKLERRKKD